MIKILNLKTILSTLRKKIRFILFLLLIVLIQVSLVSCKLNEKTPNLLQTIQKRNKIIAGVKFDSRPFGFIDKDEKLKGIDVELTREIARRILGSADAVEFKPVTSSNRILLLTSGDIDLIIATMTINDQRARVIDFSDSYFTAGQALLVRKDSNIASITNLNNKKIIVVLGSTAEKNIRQLAPKAVIKGYKTYTEAFSALKSGEADALTTDDTIITGFLHDNPDFKMLSARYTKEFYGIGFRKGEDTVSFQQVVNDTLDEIKADGTLNKIIKKWMNESHAKAE